MNSRRKRNPFYSTYSRPYHFSHGHNNFLSVFFLFIFIFFFLFLSKSKSLFLTVFWCFSFFFPHHFHFFFLFPFVLVVISFLLLLNYCNAQYEFGFFLWFSAFSSAFCRFFNSPNKTMGTRYVNDGRIGWMNGHWVARVMVLLAGWTIVVDLWEGDGNCIVDFRIVVVHCVRGVISLRLLLAPAKKKAKKMKMGWNGKRTNSFSVISFLVHMDG